MSFDTEIFDDPSAMARNGIDMDVADSASALLDAGIDIDDRAAVERTAIFREFYCRNPEAFRRFIDAVVSSARYQRDHADEGCAF
jgi:hypothetical protein